MKQQIMRRFSKIMNRVPDLRSDTCSFCNNRRCVEIYDGKDNGIRYTYLLDMIEKNPNFKADYSNADLVYAKCKRCGARYYLDWTHNHLIPRPLHINYQIRIMLDRYFYKL